MLDLFTVVWGKRMTDSFLGATVPSLLQPHNLLATRRLGTYTIYADPPTRRRVMADPRYPELEGAVRVRWEPLQGGRWEVNSNVLHQMKRAAGRGSHLLVVSPDWVIGDGSMPSMARLCAKGHNPILYGFPRLSEIGWSHVAKGLALGEVVTNRQLVSMAMKHIEQVTYRTEVAAFDEKIVHNNAWYVWHNVPTPCLRPDPWMVEEFASNPTLNSGYDHALPYMLVEKGYPWHFIDSSDTYFQVERGRHLIQDKVVDTSGGWRRVKAMKGLEFFGQQRALWQGV